MHVFLAFLPSLPLGEILMPLRGTTKWGENEPQGRLFSEQRGRGSEGFGGQIAGQFSGSWGEKDYSVATATISRTSDSTSRKSATSTGEWE